MYIHVHGVAKSEWFLQWGCTRCTCLSASTWIQFLRKHFAPKTLVFKRFLHFWGYKNYKIPTHFFISIHQFKEQFLGILYAGVFGLSVHVYVCRTSSICNISQKLQYFRNFTNFDGYFLTEPSMFTKWIYHAYVDQIKPILHTVHTD